ncbi:hypothetical protein BU25DRAFT_495394 [Macroventuria anomochaeta]|uniref:Uncharacterized protein n=1 Tax=Macroventuria anomochaeta TaxID=301207 RepID=A0ACB6RJM0_9PLEO|nr:uncharacterized protein BU25DRAFT_495394 [Macroventuria anomochaeta]KAF2621964.1 hypothetical protein BU25DRAFT_495394 [Macroventuria anomochaeta]
MLDQESEELSPFVIPQEDVEVLNASEGFCILRNYLARDISFCAQHDECDTQTKETWILHRDLLHALVMPVLELFNRASALAEAALCTHKSEDLELAFAGEARGAFLCLQCFVDEEEDWCRTRGCPACITSTTLSTESHLRLTIAASLLSTSSVATLATSPSTSEEPSTSRALPPLPHILPALRDALSSDPFWGPDHWPYLLSRATQLSTGIQALIAECVNLESLVSSPVADRTAFIGGKRSFTTPGLQYMTAQGEKKGVKLRKSKLAKRQLRLEREEIELMRRVAMQCWAKAKLPKGVRSEMLGQSGEDSRRRRSLTCP